MLNLEELKEPVQLANPLETLEQAVLHREINSGTRLPHLVYNFVRSGDKTITKQEFKSVITNGELKVANNKVTYIGQVLNLYNEMFNCTLHGIDSLSLINGEENAVSVYNRILNPGTYGFGGEPRWQVQTQVSTGYRSEELIDEFNKFLEINSSVQDQLTQALNIGAFLAQGALFTFKNSQTAVIATTHELMLRGYPPLEFTPKVAKALQGALETLSFKATRQVLADSILKIG